MSGVNNAMPNIYTSSTLINLNYSINHILSTSINACSRGLVLFWSGGCGASACSLRRPLRCTADTLHSDFQDHAMQLQCTAATSCPPALRTLAHSHTLTVIQNPVFISFFFSSRKDRSIHRSTPPCWASCRGEWRARPRWSACSCWPGRSGTGRRLPPPPSGGTDWSGPPCRAAARLWAAGGWGVQRRISFWAKWEYIFHSKRDNVTRLHSLEGVQGSGHPLSFGQQWLDCRVFALQPVDGSLQHQSPPATHRVPHWGGENSKNYWVENKKQIHAIIKGWRKHTKWSIYYTLSPLYGLVP